MSLLSYARAPTQSHAQCVAASRQRTDAEFSLVRQRYASSTYPFKFNFKQENILNPVSVNPATISYTYYTSLRLRL